MSSPPFPRRRAPFLVFVSSMAIGCGGLLELPTSDGDDGPSGSGVGQAGGEDDGNGPGTVPGRERPRGPKTPGPSEPPGTKQPNGSLPNLEVGDPYCPPPTKFDARQYDSRIAGYKPSATPTASCTAADLTRLELNIATTAVNAEPFARLMAGLGAECQSCIVTPSSADAWGPVVEFDEKVPMGNIGACHAVVNESVECGKAVQYHAACTREACMVCSYSAVKACVPNVRSAQCKETYDAAAAACPKLAQSKTQCGFGPAELVPHVGNLVANARAFCGAGL